MQFFFLYEKDWLRRGMPCHWILLYLCVIESIDTSREQGIERMGISHKQMYTYSRYVNQRKS